MPILRRADGAVKSVNDPAAAAALVAAGGWEYANREDAKSVPTVDPVSGLQQRTALEDYNLDIGAGQQHHVALGEGQLAQQSANAYTEDQYSSIDQNALGAVEGAGSVLSFGLTDAIGAGLGTDVAAREDHTTGRTVGEIAGIAATVVAPWAGASALATPATALSRAAAGAATRAGRVGLAGAEGALMGAGNVLSNVALSEPGLTAESLAANAGDFAHGILLGGALGVVGGGIGEGVGALAARRAAKSPKLEFDSAIGKEVTNDFTNAHRTIDSLADDAMRAAPDAAAAKMAAEVGPLHASIRAAAGLPDEAIAPLRNMRATVGQMLETGALDSRAISELIKENHRIASQVGTARVAKDVYLGSEKGFAKLLADTDGLIARASSADGVLEKLAADLGTQPTAKTLTKYANRAREVVGDLKNPELTAAVDDLVVRAQEALKAPTFSRAAAREALVLREGEKLTPAAMKRFMEAPDLLDRIKVLGKYYNEVQAATGTNATSKLQFQDAIKQYGAAAEKMLTPEAAKALTPHTMAVMIGGPAGLELVDSLVDLPEPLHRVLQLAAVMKGLGGLGAMKVKGSSWLRRIVRSAGNRSAARLGSSFGANGPAGDALSAALGPLGRPIASGVGSAAATSVLGAATKRMRAVRAAADQTTNVKQHISDKVLDLTKGQKPGRKMRILPGIHKALDKLIGDPKESKGKSEQEKFKIVQDRLARFSASPQSVLDGVYHFLKPVQEAIELVADIMETIYGIQFEHAFETMPKDPGTMMSFGKSMWQPTDRALYEWGMELAGSLFPLEVIDGIASGLVAPQAVQALAKTNPAIFNEFIRNVMENGDAIRDNATYDQKIALGLALQMPVEPTTDPQYVAFIQNSHAEQTMTAAAGPTQDKSSPEEEYSDAQKLLS